MKSTCVWNAVDVCLSEASPNNSECNVRGCVEDGGNYCFGASILLGKSRRVFCKFHDLAMPATIHSLCPIKLSNRSVPRSILVLVF